MNVRWNIFFVLFCAVRFEVFASSAIWMDSLIGYIKNYVNAYQVTLITNSGYSSTVNPTVDKLLYKIGVNFATLKINVAGPTGLYEDIVSRAVADGSTVFFVLVYVSDEPMSIGSLEKMMDTARKIAAYKSRPRILLVLRYRVISDSLEEILNNAWSKQLLDFTIVEIDDGPRRTNVVSGVDVRPIIHQFDPFKEKYTRTKWTHTIEWFPNKVKNMQGYHLKIGVTHMPPYTITIPPNKGTEPVLAIGANIDVIRAIGRELNCSITFVHIDSLMRNCSDAATICYHNILRSGEVDMLGFLSPNNYEISRFKSLQTRMIRIQQLCPLVPILYKTKMLLRPNLSALSFALSFAVVMVFWIASRILRFQSPVWRVFNLAQVLFGMSATQQPRVMAERTLFACLLSVSAIYSTTMFTAITGISLETNVEMKFNTFEDLDNSGLTPMITSNLYDKTFGRETPSWANIKEKVLVLRNSNKCIKYLTKHKNVTCLMITEEAEKMIEVSGIRTQAKIVKPCFWRDTMGFLLAEGSPYRSQINYIIEGLDDSGTITRFYKNPALGRRNDNGGKSLTDAKQNGETLYYQLLAILIVGHTLALIVFIAEIMIFKISKAGIRLRCNH